MQKLKLSDQEFAYMKALALFSPGEKLFVNLRAPKNEGKGNFSKLGNLRDTNVKRVADMNYLKKSTIWCI